MVGFKRTERVSDQIRMEIADILMRRVKDPRVGFVTVTAVDVTADLKQAWVYVTVLQQGAQEVETLGALSRAEGFIRGELGRRLTLRYVPALKFVKDTSIDRVTRVLNLLDEVRPKQAESRDESAGSKDRGPA
jgi:ribosome-binding factor A